MSRHLIQQVIDLKKRLHEEEHDLDTKAAEIYQREPWVKDPTRDPLDLTPDEAESKANFLDLEVKKLAVKQKLTRAQVFGLRHSKGATRPCITCFVGHGEVINMVSVEPAVLGTALFRCERCGHELKEF